MSHLARVALLAGALAGPALAQPAAPAPGPLPPQWPCATAVAAPPVRDYYARIRPGVPLPIPSRYLNMPELSVASALPAGSAVGTVGGPDAVRRIWQSIDSWGATTRVNLVFTSGGRHAYNFPSLVPITQPTKNDGFYDVYADGGRGVHAHIAMDQVRAIYATRLPGAAPGSMTRAISFYGADGHLIIGVYATSANAEPDPAALAGFERTWTLIESMPRACPTHP